jgi:hypothetical protein
MERTQPDAIQKLKPNFEVMYARADSARALVVVALFRVSDHAFHSSEITSPHVPPPDLAARRASRVNRITHTLLNQRREPSCVRVHLVGASLA